MKTRLSSLLVAGGVVLAGIQVASAALPGAAGADPKTPATTDSRTAALVGASLETQGAAAQVLLRVPGYSQQPKLQVLPGPWRVVVDLPGVNKVVKFGKTEARVFAHPLVQAARIAQFSVAPNAVTRVVLEVVPGTQVQASVGADGVSLHLAPGAGAVHASLGTASPRLQPAPVVPAPVAIEHEVVTAQAAPPSAVAPATETKDLPAVALVAPAEKTEVRTLPELASVPAVGATYRPLPSLIGTALLPMSLGEARPQDPAPAPEAKPQQGHSGPRMLGEGPTKYTGSRLSIDIHSASVMTFLMILADHARLNLVADPEVETLTGSFKFTETPWDLILDMVLKHHGLGKEIDHGVIRVAKLEKLQKEEDDRKKLEEAKALAGEVQSITRPLSYARASDVKNIIKEMLTKRGSVIIDDRTNTLIITDLTRNLGLIDDLIAQLDIAIQQVQIEAKVVEASQGYQKAFGVKWPTGSSGAANIATSTGSDAAWGALNSPSWNSINSRPGAGQNSTLLAFTPGKDGVTSIPSAAGEFWISFLSNRVSINAILQGLESDGTIKIVSSPKLVTQNNKKGKILSGEKIPYPAIQASGGGGGGAITVQFADANLELDVTPQITSDGTVMMDLNIKKAEADFTRTVNGTPTIVTKEIQTMVLVKDGGTAILGGVYITNHQSGSTGVPFLSKLPLLGWLFRNKTQQNSNKELLVFITPRIIKN